MVVGIESAWARHLPEPPPGVQVAVAADAPELVSALAAGVYDWIVWPRAPGEDLMAWCRQVLRERQLAAACTLCPAAGRLEVYCEGHWLERALGPTDGRDSLSLPEARAGWLAAWANWLSARERGHARDGVPARDSLLACLVRPTVGSLEDVLGVSKKHLEVERKRLERGGYRGPGRLALVVRVLLAWEGLRAGRALRDVADGLGYSELPALERAVKRVAGVTASELARLTDVELAGRLRVAMRRGGEFGKR